MRKLTTILIGLLFVSSVVMGQNYTVPSINIPTDYGTIYYIDPSGSNGDGSIGNPYNTLQGLTIQSNTAYLIKAGETLNEAVGKWWTNNYIGKYGGSGVEDNPIITGTLNAYDPSTDLTIDSIRFIKPGTGTSDQIIRLSDNGIDYVTIANCEVRGTDTGNGYPFYNMKSKGNHITLYHNIFAYCRNDGWYTGDAPNVKVVSNYFHHQNMSGIDRLNSTGDGIQFENIGLENGYIANNFIDRQHTFWKFALIINSDGTDDKRGLVVEYNTLISPKSGAGGAALMWEVSSPDPKESVARYNLFNTNTGVMALHSWDTHVNQPDPYGFRNNAKFGVAGYNDGLSLYPSNLDFSTESAYNAYIIANPDEFYGSDIDTSNFWGGASATNPCAISPMGVTDTIGNDTNSRGTGFIDITVTGGYTGKTYLWSNTEVTEDISDLLAGNYSVTITDDSSCTTIENYTVSLIDTTTGDGDLQFLTVDTIYSNFEDGDNVATNMLDGNFNTRWSNNINPAVAVVVLDNIYIIDTINIAWYRGNIRRNDFALFVSQDSINYTQVYADSSAGDTLGYESYDVTDAVGKYIKIEGYGNSEPVSTGWTSITEFRALGDSASGCIDINQSAVIVNEQNDNDNGSIDLTASGGSGVLSYLWTPGNTTSPDTSGLNTGAYTVVVTDDSSCTSTDTYNVYNNVTSEGEADTTIYTNNFDGFTVGDKLSDSADFTSIIGDMEIEDNGASNVITGDITGNNFVYYNVDSSDNIDIKMKILQTSASSYSAPFARISDTSCYMYRGRNNNGHIVYWSAATGFTQLTSDDGGWDVGDFVKLTVRGDTLKSYINDVLQRTYINTKLNITPFHGGVFALNSSGQEMDSLQITFYTEGGTTITYPIDATVEQINVICYGDSTGSLVVTPFNGVPPYTHSWSNDSITSSITNLVPGVYLDSLRDVNDSLTLKTYTITQNDSIYYETFIFNTTNEEPLGHINITTISGGNGTYVIEWDNGSSVTSRTDLPPGDYWFIITDGLGCTTDTVNVTVANNTCYTIGTSAISTAAPNGTLTLIIDPPEEEETTLYTYEWSNGETTKDLDSLDSGVYSVIVTNIYSACQAFGSYQVANIPTIRRVTVINTGGKVRLNQNGKIITQ